MQSTAPKSASLQTSKRSCFHCGLPVPESRRTSNILDDNDQPAEGNFCCSGCEFVYGVIQQHGLSQFYDFKKSAASAPSEPPTPGSKSFAYFDEADFLSEFVRQLPSGESQFSLLLEGVHCSACVWLIEKSPEILEGFHEARLNFATRQVVLRYDPASVTPSAIANLFDSLGYSPYPITPAQRDLLFRSEHRKMLMRVGVAGLAAGNTMLFAISLYQGFYTGIDASYRALLHWASFFVSLPAILYSAFPFYRAAVQGLRMRTVHIDLPISIGIILGFAISMWNLLEGREHVYFDSLCMLIFLLLIGRWAQQSVLAKARQQSELQPSFLPLSAVLIKDSAYREVLAQSLTPGDMVRVPCGEMIPVDGRVSTGNSHVDNSILTGEFAPVAVEPSSHVFAGARNISYDLDIEVTASADQSRIGKLLQMAASINTTSATFSHSTDRLAAFFTIAVLVLAAVTIIFWADSGLQIAMERALALVVICCPCAIGLAAPVTYTLAIGQAARRGIIIRTGSVFEQFQKVEQAFLDKTGTLTSGKLTVEQVAVYESGQVYEITSNFQAERPELTSLFQALKMLERDVAHPVGQALSQFAISMTAAPALPVDQLTIVPGKGVESRDRAGVLWRIGSMRYLQESGAAVPDELREVIDQFTGQSWSPVLLSKEQVVFAVFGIGDSIRSGAENIVRELQKTGSVVHILTGDIPSPALHVARQLGISDSLVLSEKTPEEKLEIVTQATARCHTLMVGDGVNDAGALGAATIGIGISGGVEACLAVCDVFIARSQVERTAELLRASYVAGKTVKRCLAFSLTYNTIGAIGAIAGYINPLTAALLMPLSSLTVVAVATLQPSFKKKREWK